MCAKSRARIRVAAALLLAMTAGAVVGTAPGAAGTPGTADAAGRSSSGRAAADDSLVDRLRDAYPDRSLDPRPARWRELVADSEFDTEPIAVIEFVRLLPTRRAKKSYDAYVAVLTAAVTRHGGTMLSVNDTLMPGLEEPERYDGGTSWVAKFPSRRSYVETVLDPRVVTEAATRRKALVEAQLMIGIDTLPEAITRLPPNEPASAFPSSRVSGKRPGQIVEDLLAVYPSGKTDPTEETLNAIVRWKGFADQRVHFINLYQYGDAPGAEALGEYNAAALPAVLAHGARPQVLMDVAHHLVGPVEWNRVIFVSWPSFAVFFDLRLDPVYIEAQQSRIVAAERYGNLITVARPQ
jgi:uncharacterized protein (DUF1330 family)